MGNISTDIQQFTKNFIEAFLIQRDAEKVISYLSPEISWIDIRNDQVIKKGETVIEFVRKIMEMHPDPLSSSNELYLPTQISDDAYCIIFKVKVDLNKKNETTFPLKLRCSCIIKVYPDDSMKIMHIHVSVPTASQIERGILPQNSEEPNFLTLQRLLHEKMAEINNFYNILSGGVCKIAFDKNYTLLYASKYLLDMFGLNLDDIKNDHNWTINYVFDEDVSYLTKILSKALKNHEQFTAKYRARHKNGHYLWVKVNGMFSGEFYQSKFPVYYCIYTDITELVQSYEFIAREKERYRIITELTEGITFEYDLTEDCIEFLNKYEQYFDCPAKIANFKQKICKEYFETDADYNKYKKLCKAFNEGAKHASAELRLKTRDGLWVWFSYSGIYFIR